MNEIKIDPDEKLEAILVERRKLELLENPVKGNFDITHLKEIHRRLLQDLPKAGCWPYKAEPGSFRPETPPHERTHYKIRALHSLETDSMSVYSKMTENDLKKLDAILKTAKPKNFKDLNKKQFAKKMATLYSDLDYIHPFSEGNSRTLRMFTEQIGREAGYKMKWEKFKTLDLSDSIKIARDRALAERARKDPNQKDNIMELDYVLKDAKKLEQHPGLAELLETSVEKIGERKQ